MRDCKYQRTAADKIRCQVCGHSRAWTRPNFPRRNCLLAPIHAAAAPAAGDCLHQGDFLRNEPCHTCGEKGKTRAVYHCNLYNTPCAARKWKTGSAPGTRFCNTCPDFRAETDQAAPQAGAVLLKFTHGLGDRIQFARLLAHLQNQRPALAVDLECPRNSRILFEGLCRSVFGPGEARGRYDSTIELPWREPQELFADAPSTKLERALKEFGLRPDPALSRYTIDSPPAARQLAAKILAAFGLSPSPGTPGEGRGEAFSPSPGTPGEGRGEGFRFVLMHNDGITGGTAKNMAPEVAAALAYAIRARGLVPVELNWRDAPKIPGALRLDLPSKDPALTHALAQQAAACVGIDSGPGFIFAASNTPTLIVWRNHHPLNYFNPSENVLHLLPPDHREKILPYARGEIDRPAAWLTARDYFRAHYRSRVASSPAEAVAALDALLDPPRYFPSPPLPLGEGRSPAADAQLRQWLQEWCRGPDQTGFGIRADRDVSLDLLCREMAARFERPQIVETGCARYDAGPNEGDWSGAGYFTLIAGLIADRTGGKLDSVDLSPKNVAFARQRTRFWPSVEIHQGDSAKFLEYWQGPPIDVAYLDSLDTEQPGHAEHGLAEARAVLPHLSPRALIVFDDTARINGTWHPLGKGALAVPWLLAQGWRILYTGYQTILTRKKTLPAGGTNRKR